MENPFPILESFDVLYKGEKIRVDLIDFTTQIPEWKFFVHIGKEGVILGKLKLKHKIRWTSGMDLSLQESETLGLEIERQWGKELPMPPSNNPFDYDRPKGTIFYSCEYFGFRVTQAKALYTADIYFKVSDREVSSILVRMECFGGLNWVPADSDMPDPLFKSTVEFIEACEKKLAWVAQ